MVSKEDHERKIGAEKRRHRDAEQSMKLKRAEDMAKQLGITTDTLLDWRRFGMPWIRIGKTVFISEDSFLKWAKDHEIIQNAQDALE